MLSITCKAAIKAVIYLGSKFGLAQRAGIKEIAAYTGENENTMGKLLQKLVRAGVINSAKGPTGGFFITEAQLEQPILHIIQETDGAGVFNNCILGLSQCSDVRPCPLHNQYAPVRRELLAMCRNMTIRRLCEDVSQGQAYLLS